MFKINCAYINSGKAYKMSQLTSNLYRVYKNSNARDLFLKAQKAETVEERQKLYDMMGEYKVVCEKPRRISKNRLWQFLKGIFCAY